MSSLWCFVLASLCWENFPGPRDHKKRLTTPALHYEFIKGAYIRGMSWMVAKGHGYPLCHLAVAKGLYGIGQGEMGPGV